MLVIELKDPLTHGPYQDEKVSENEKTNWKMQ
jgi:hypothetical protein